MVIPNWNGAARLGRTLLSVREQTLPVGRVIVVDNGSSDESPQIAEAAGATVIQLGTNRGFAAAVNRGVEAAATEFVLILNNDVQLSRTWIATQSSAIGQRWFAVGKLLDSHSRTVIDGTFDLIARSGCAWRAGAGQPDTSFWNRPREITLPPLTAALVRTELFERAGHLDERFESYLEDVDFGLRCGSQGYTGVYVPEAVAYHEGSATFGRWDRRTIRLIARNQVLIVAKHYPSSLVREYGWAIAIGQMLWGVVALKHGGGWAWLRGKFEGLRMYPRLRERGGPRVRELLQTSEDELHQVQLETARDRYWRIYFAMTR